MESEETSTHVEYLSENAEVRLVKGIGTESWNLLRGRHQGTGTRRCKPVLVFVLITLLGLIIAGPALTFFFLRGTQKNVYFSSPYKQNQYDESPEVSKLTLAAVGADSFTVTWEQPDSPFDYYRVEVTAGASGDSGTPQLHRAGSCATGRILHPNQTRVTCDHLQACTNVTFTVKTHRNGPHQSTSSGTTLWDIFIPGKEPDSPMDITIVGESPSRSLLKWAGPKEWSAVHSTCAVMVCTSFSACDAEAGDIDCTNYETPVMKLPFDSTADTAYCVMVTATTRCGGDVIRSRPAAAVVRTPAFRPPDVSKVKVTVVGNDSFTVSWQRPEGQFDYYWMEVTDSNAVLGSSEHRHVGSCISGTLLRPHQTQVRCSQVKSCTNASLTIYTHVNGPPEQTSHGVTVEGIFIPGKDLHTPRNITFTWKSTTLTRVQWNPSAAPRAPARLYIVEICDAYGVCDASEQDRSCSHHETSKTWLDFESIADTEYCVLVTSGARCGSGIVRSTPASATFMTPTFGPPDVTNMTLEDIGVDSFTVSWERPKGHFDYYWVAVTDDKGSRGGSEHFHVDSCRNGTILHPEQTRITCGHLEACTNVSFNIRTHSNGPPARTSAGVTLGGIVIPGAAPGDFRADVTATSNTSVQIVIHVSDVKSCLLDDCRGHCFRRYGGGSAFWHDFACNDHDGLTSVVTLDGLESDSHYICSVTLINVHKGQDMRKLKLLDFDTPK